MSKAAKHYPATRMERVEVHWEDSHAFYGWNGRREMKRWARKERCFVVSVGLLLRDDEEGMVLVQGQSQWQSLNGLKIPREAIRMVRRLKPRTRRK